MAEIKDPENTIIMETTKGKVVIQLLPGLAPGHVARIKELAREGVDVTGVITDKERLTALVLLGIRDEDHFPLIFYRENCADMALSADDIDEDFIARSRAVIATGTSCSACSRFSAVTTSSSIWKSSPAVACS